MKFYLFLSVFLYSGLIFSQNFEIEGKITDPDGSPLGSATVYLEKQADSSLVTYTISKENGTFQLSGNSKAPKLNLFVSYAGFKPYFTQIEPKDKDLGTLVMEVQDNELGEITLTAERAPVSVKADTLEFNAASFKTREDANLEEVLKELPGVAVDNEGNITVNGKPVSRILINGKEFFGDDPKIATKNLPKEIINKIQVVDTKTKSEEFTGKEGDSENKTINITIDEDKNRGYFTRLTAGAGTDDRYELSGISNYFKDKMRVSVLASSNNINSSGFTFDEVFDAMGRNAYSISRNSNGNFSINGFSYGGGRGGITETDNIGASFVNEWAKKTELSLNYFYNHADNRNETRIERENILPDRRYFVDSESSSNRLNDNHRFSTGFEIQPDTLTRISVRTNFNTTKGESFSDSFTESRQPDGMRINNALTTNRTDVFNSNLSGRIYFTRKFGDKGGFYSLGFDNDNQTQDQQDFFYSRREVFNDADEVVETQVQDQLIDEDNKQDEYALNLNGRLPISDNLDLDFEFRYEDEDAKNERLIYNADEQGEYSMLDEGLSNDFRSELSNLRPSAGFVYNNDTLRVGLSAGLHHTRLKNVDLFSQTRIDNTYNNLYGNAYMSYKFTKSKAIYLNYRNRRETPQISQLQPVNNTTNPLNIITGNPNLRPSFVNSFYMNFNDYDFSSRSGYYVYMSGQFTQDDVVPITTTGEDLVRTTTYTNVDGTYRIFGGASLDKKIELDSIHSVQIKPGVYGNLNKRIGFSNEVKYDVENLILNPHVGFQYDWDEKLSLEPNYRISIVSADYSLNDTRENYINHDLSFQLTSYWPKKFILGSDMSYQKFGNISSEFKNSFLLWNASLGYKLLGDDGILKVKVFDILDENTSTSRITGDDFIQNTEELVLERYLMFSFTWKFSKFGGKDPNDRRRGFF